MRAEHWKTVTVMAEAQLGLVSSPQLEYVGCSRREVDRARQRGLLLPVRRGVHLVSGTPPSPYHPILGACLAAGGDTYASHLAAVGLWDFTRAGGGHLETTTFFGRRRTLEGVRTHSSAMLLSTDVDRRHGVPVTSAARTTLDAAGVLTVHLLAKFVDYLRRRRFATYADVGGQLDALGGRGRPGTGALRAVLAPRLEGLDAGDSDAEVRVVQTLLRYGVPRPVQNLAVEAGPKVYVLDLAWPALRIAVELDGFDPHGILRETFDHDRERDLRLKRAGWEVIHVSTRTDLHLLADYLLERFASCE